MKINIIGDIAGRYDELMLLLEKMPEADLVLSVGDMVDRGKQSRQVLEWFMKTENAEAIYGNHEDMFVEGVVHQNLYMWLQNGGGSTLQSFADEGQEIQTVGDVDVPAEIIEWLQKRPLYYQTDDLVVSHAPVVDLQWLPKDPYNRSHSFIWNRYAPQKPQSKFMIYGHNGILKVHKDKEGKRFAMCIDNSHTGHLTGIHWPTQDVYKQEFLDREEFAEYYREDKSDEELAE